MSTINFNGRKFTSHSVKKSKTADALVKRYAVLYPKMSEANVRELFAVANGSVSPEVGRHTITSEDLENNPDLVDAGIKVGEEITYENADASELPEVTTKKAKK